MPDNNGHHSASAIPAVSGDCKFNSRPAVVVLLLQLDPVHQCRLVVLEVLFQQ